MSDQNRLRFIDSDGHVLEHPTEMVDFAPAEYRDRIWHIETDRDGTEWLVFDGSRSPANRLAVAGTAGMSAAENRRAMAGEMKYTEVKPAAYNAKARLEDMTEDHIDMSVLYPTMLLGIQSNPDVEFADVQCRAYNDWLAAHVADGEGRLFGAAALPQQDIERAAAELRSSGPIPPPTGGPSATVCTTPCGARPPTLDFRSDCIRSSSPIFPERASACASTGSIATRACSRTPPAGTPGEHRWLTTCCSASSSRTRST
jgi:hypothetical protein